MSTDTPAQPLTDDQVQAIATYFGVTTDVVRAAELAPKLAASPQPAQEPLAAERQRIALLLQEIRAHWVKTNGADSISVGALDQIAEVIADGSYVVAPTQAAPAPTRAQINDWMTDAGWQNSAMRQADLDRVERVVLAALSRASGAHNVAIEPRR